MTCIAAIAHGPHVTMGGDSAVSYIGTRVIRANKKVVRSGQYVIGFSGAARCLDIIIYAFTPPEPTVGESLDAFMSNQFSEALRQTLEKFGALGEDKDSKMPTITDRGTMIVGVLGKIYFLDSVLSCHRMLDPFFSIGAGGDFALGSLASGFYHRPDLSITDRLRKALEIAARFSESVCEPFHFVSTDPEFSDQPTG